MNLLELSGQFHGWTVDQEKGSIFDEAGNQYDITDIRQVFVTRQWLFQHTGTDSQIISLKQRLIDRINDCKMPVVTVRWGDQEIELKHPLHSGLVY